MIDAPDAVLLEEFARNDSEEAFTEIVRRHVGLVHSVAFRQTQNAQHAEEITQAVFIILARKASSLGRKTILGGWLYHTARLTTANFQRAEVRRVHREQNAFMQPMAHDEQIESAWQEMGPLLEEAMSKLKNTDRDAIVLRFFENKSLREVGTAMGLQERAAQKRVARGLEKLRAFFTKRGVVLTTAVIAGAVSANSVQAAPAGIVATVAVSAKAATATASTLALVKGTMKMIAWSSLKTPVVAGVGILLFAGAAVTAEKVTSDKILGSRVYETEMVESYPAFPLHWSADKKTISGPFLSEIRPANREGLWDPGFRIGPSILGWSLGGDTGDWIYMINPLPPSEPRWEFALSSKRELDSVTKKDLQVEFYGSADPRGPEVFNDHWGTNAIRVATNQLFFARLVTNRSTTYVVQLAKRDITTNHTWGAAMARYIAVDSPQPVRPAHSQEPGSWQQRFEAVYKLKDGEALRYIPQPFIPERLTYYHTEESLASQAKAIPGGPDIFVFQQDEKGQLHDVMGGFGKPTLLWRIFDTTSLGFRSFRKFEFEGDNDFLNIAMPGDWTIREGTSRESFLAALEPIIYQATGRQFHFEKQTIERDVLVARGQFKDGPDWVKIYAEKPVRGGRGYGDLQDMLGALGDDLGMYIVNEAEAGPGASRFQWNNYPDADFSKMGARRRELTDKVLKNVSEQTGITFSRERRPVEVWVVTEKK